MHEISSQEPIWGAIISSPPPLNTWKRKKVCFKIVIICYHEFRCKFLVLYSLQFWVLMWEFCQMTWTFQNLISSQKYQISDLQKGPINKKCFLIRELQMRKLFHWHCVFTQTWYLEQEPKWPLTKIFAGCDEIMLLDEIRWFDGRYFYCSMENIRHQFGIFF